MELEEEMPNPQTNVDTEDEEKKSISCEQIEQTLTEKQAQTFIDCPIGWLDLEEF